MTSSLRSSFRTEVGGPWLVSMIFGSFVGMYIAFIIPSSRTGLAPLRGKPRETGLFIFPEVPAACPQPQQTDDFLLRAANTRGTMHGRRRLPGSLILYPFQTGGRYMKPMFAATVLATAVLSLAVAQDTASRVAQDAKAEEEVRKL